MSKQKIYISASSIQTFNKCKRKFKYKYIDKLQVFQRTTNKYISFGESIHKTLAQYNALTEKKNQSLSILHDLLRKNWIREGYETIQEEKNFGLRALDMLTNYFNNKQDNGKRVLTEEMIKTDLDDRFVLCGKIDTAYVREDGLLEVSDYKTGNTINSSDAIQLPIYVHLTKHRLGDYPHLISNYYLTFNDKIEIPVTDELIEKSKLQIETICTSIANELSFPYTPTPYCKNNCEYYEMCEGAKDVNAIVINELNNFKTSQDQELLS